MKTAREFAEEWHGRHIDYLEMGIYVRDAEHRAELDAAQATIEQLGKDAAALAAESERLKGELAEAKLPVPMLIHCPMCKARHIDVGAFATKVHHTHSCQTCGHTWRPAVVATVGVEFLPGFKNAAPPPAESTPVYRTEANCGASVTAESSVGLNRELAKHAEACVKCQAIRGRTSLLAGLERARDAAPPDDIRERLADHERRLAALEAKGSDRCARADCGRPRRWGGHEGHHEFVSALEAKGEPGTHAKGAKP